MLRFRANRSGLIVLACSITFAVAAISFAALGNEPTLIEVTGKGTISIPTASLRRGEAKFFLYKGDNGSRVKFIVARDETGRVEAAVDACERCAAYGQGYTSSKGYVTCRYCGNRYGLHSLSTGWGSCVPLKLNYVVRDDDVQIRTAELDRWRRVF